MRRYATLRLRTHANIGPAALLPAKRILPAALFLLVRAMTAAPQEPIALNEPAQAEVATTTEGVDEVLAAYVQALGGHAALDRLTARRADGLIEIPNRPDRSSFYTRWHAPQFALLEVHEPDAMAQLSGLSGKFGWREGTTEWGTYERLTPHEIEDLLRVANPLRYANLKDLSPGLVREVVTTPTAGAVLRAVTPDAVNRYLFDANTHLLNEIEEQRKDESFPRHYEFKNYRRIDGVLFPYLLHEIVPLPNLDPAAARIERFIRFRKVTHNASYEARGFQPDRGWTLATKPSPDDGDIGAVPNETPHVPDLEAPPSILDLEINAAAAMDPLMSGVMPAAPVIDNPFPPDGVQLILDAYIEALGGRAALNRLRSRRSQAIVVDLTSPVSRSLVVTWQSPDDGCVELFEEGREPQLTATNGTLGWTQRVRTQGALKLNAEPIRDLLLLADPVRFVRLRSLYPGIAVEPSGGRRGNSFVLRAQTSYAIVRFVFDPVTHLLKELQELTPGLAEPREFELEDYREIDGIQFPYSIHESFTIPGAPGRLASQDKIIRFQKVQHNVEIPAQLFTPPAGLLSETAPFQ